MSDYSYGEYGSEAMGSSYGEEVEGRDVPDDGEYSGEYHSDDDRSADDTGSEVAVEVRIVHGRMR